MRCNEIFFFQQTAIISFRDPHIKLARSGYFRDIILQQIHRATVIRDIRVVPERDKREVTAKPAIVTRTEFTIPHLAFSRE